MDQGKWNEIRTEQWNLPPEVGAGIQAQLVDKLEKSGYFIVMEREATAENQASQEDQIDATKRASLAPGTIAVTRQQRTVGNFIITPSVIGFVPTGGGGSGVSFGGIHLGGKKAESTVTLSIRISDAQTSEIIDTQTATGKAEAKSSGLGLNFQGANFSNDQFQSSPAGQAVDRALDDAVAKIVARLSKEPWTALVAAQDKATNRVIINAGNQSGVEVGQVFIVYHAGIRFWTRTPARKSPKAMKSKSGASRSFGSTETPPTPTFWKAPPSSPATSSKPRQTSRFKPLRFPAGPKSGGRLPHSSVITTVWEPVAVAGTLGWVRGLPS